METPRDKLIQIIEIIKEKITPEINIIWTSYNSVDEINIDLSNLIHGIRTNDIPTFSKLEILFAPTGSFQELSIDNGWGEEFIHLSKIFDRQMEILKSSS